MRAKRKIACAVAAVTCLCSVGQITPMVSHAENPIIQTSFTPDPAPVIFGDELWVFTGRDRNADNDFYYMTGWQAFSTTDMKNWTNHGCFLEDDEYSWCNENDAWASQCIERNGKYYFYFTTTNKSGGGRAVGVGVADNPEGPYKDVLGKPLCGPNWDYIDPTVMIDDDGQAWLMFGNPTCYYVKLKEDMVTLDGPIMSFDMTVEAFGQGKNKTAYGEGPWICKHGDLYYLVYAGFYGSDGGESICYAYGPSVTGPWKFGGKITPESNCFTTHGGIIDYKGHSYLFYHKNGLPGGGSFKRSAAVEEFTFNPDGTIPMVEPTNEGPAQLEAFNPYRRVEAETGSWFEGLEVEPAGNGSQAVGFIQNGDYIKISGVDFGDEGASEFYASVASAGEGGKIELHLDSVQGPIVGTVTCPVTGGWQEFTTVSGDVKGATGEHDLYLRFAGGDGYLFNVDWWQFRESNEGPFLLGDVDSNGAITATDLSLAKKLMFSGNGDMFQTKAADVDQDGKVTADDIAWYVEYLNKKITEYPEKKVPEVTTPPDPAPSNYSYNTNLQYHEAPGNYFQPSSNPGKLVNETYTGINGQKKLNVYLPPNYDPNKKYNVLYMMHGGGENENVLVNDSDKFYVHYMIENMIANGEVDPMIVVFPTFNGCPDGAGDVWDEMKRSIVPFVEGKYSTYAENTTPEGLEASRMHRAYGGFSMGGGSTWNCLINDIDIFAYFMPLSGHCWGGAEPILNTLKKSKYQNSTYILAATGTEDIAYGNMCNLINELKKDSVIRYGCDFSKNNFFFLEASGKTHWWGFVKHYIYDVLPYFFREGQ